MARVEFGTHANRLFVGHYCCVFFEAKSKIMSDENNELVRKIVFFMNGLFKNK